MKKKKLLRDLGILLALFIGAWVFFAYYPVTDSEVVKTNYKQKEQEVKENLIEFMNYQAAGSDDSELMKALSEVQYLIQEPDIKYELYLSNSSDINAFALPGNMVVVNRGLLKMCETPEELIGAVAHEVGHLKHNHINEQLIKSLGIELLFSGSNTSLGEVTQLLTQSAFSRENEIEADEYAINKLIELEISPNYLAKLFKKLYTETSMVPDFLNTHPGLNERISNFKKYEFKESNRKYEFDWVKVKNSL